MRAVFLCLLASLVVLAGSDVNAQDDAFRVDSYTPKRFQDFEWNLSLGSSLGGTDSDDPDIDGSNTYKSLGFNLANDWSYRYETLNQWLTLSPRLSGRMSYSDREDHALLTDINFMQRGTSSRDSRYQEMELLATIEGGTYVSGDVFVSSLILPSLRYYETPKNDDISAFERIMPYGLDSLYRRIDNDTTEATNVHHYQQLDMQAGGGFGRVYNGVFAYTALSMIAELRDAGLLAQEPTYEDMMVLTEVIYQNQQRHAIDTRVHRMESLTEIMTILSDRNIINDAGPGTYVRVQDVWDYFPRTRRDFGMRVRGGFGWAYEHDSYRDSRVEKNHRIGSYYAADSSDYPGTLTSQQSVYHRSAIDKETFSSPYVFTRVEYYRPLSTNWQFNLTAEGRWFVDAHSEWNVERNYYEPTPQLDRARYRVDFDNYIQADLDVEIRYLLDSRTSLTGSWTVNAYERDVNVDSLRLGSASYRIGDESTYRFRSELGGKLTYRVSLPTTLTASVNLRRDYREERQTVAYDFWGYSFAVKMEHYLY